GGPLDRVNAQHLDEQRGRHAEPPRPVQARGDDAVDRRTSERRAGGVDISNAPGLRVLRRGFIEYRSTMIQLTEALTGYPVAIDPSSAGRAEPVARALRVAAALADDTKGGDDGTVPI